jgi:hypothetical protein
MGGRIGRLELRDLIMNEGEKREKWKRNAHRKILVGMRLWQDLEMGLRHLSGKDVRTCGGNLSDRPQLMHQI